MKIEKLTAFLFIIILMPYFSSALNYDELLDSYNYDYNANSVNITNVSSNDCENCNNLSVVLSLIGEPGNYEIYGFFDNKTSEFEGYLFDERASITLTFTPPFQKDSDKLWVKILKNNELLYFSNVTDIDLSDREFNTAKVNVTDDFEKDGLLNIVLNADVPISGNYLVTGYLKSGENIITVKQNENIDLNKNFNLVFDPGIDGTFILTKVMLNESVFDIGYNTKNYSFAKIRFINSSIVDGNLLLNVFVRDNLTVSFYLFDSFSNLIGVAQNNEGKVFFDGDETNLSASTGPYILKAAIMGLKYDYMTNYFNYSDFNKNEILVVHDYDKDGVPDSSDNCPNIYNPSQNISDCSPLFFLKLLSFLDQLVYGTNPYVADSDNDGLNDDAEITAGADPNNKDTDGDGILDGADNFPTNPDVNNNGVLDGMEM